MFNSELFRIGIILPLTEAAEEDLNYNNVSAQTDVKAISLTSRQFYKLWDTGIFKNINEELGKLITDYEEEFLEGTQLLLLNKLINETMLKKNIDQETRTILPTMSEFLLEAFRLNRRLFFIF